MAGLWWKSGLAVLALGAGLSSETPPAPPRAPRQVVELRNQFIREQVIRPFREHMGKGFRGGRTAPGHSQERPHGEPQHRGEATATPFVPFLLPYVSGPSCVEVVCSLVGPLGCDSDERTLRIFRMCNGSYSGDCVRAVCARLMSVECDTAEAIQPVVAACKSNASGDCLEAACRLLGDLQCDSFAQAARVLDACAGNVDGSCVTAVCTSLGPLRCSTIDDLAPVAQICASNQQY